METAGSSNNFINHGSVGYLFNLISCVLWKEAQVTCNLMSICSETFSTKPDEYHIIKAIFDSCVTPWDDLFDKSKLIIELYLSRGNKTSMSLELVLIFDLNVFYYF